MNLEIRDFALRDIGCIATLMWRERNGLPSGKWPCEKHHLNAFDMPGGKRRGERFTIGLSQWSHVGRCWCNGFPIDRDCPQCKAERGPSWRWHKREFIDTFGYGDALLAEQERRIAEWSKSMFGAAA